MAKRSSFGSTIRKRLSDITNYQPQLKSPPVFDQIYSHNASSSSSSTKEYIDHLLKENAGLMKLIADKNKVIELSGIELEKLRVTLQKTQLQNWNLAQSNSHMLAELNLGKQKLKALQHELICKEALLKTKNLELEGQLKTNSQKNGSKDGNDAENKEYNGKRCGRLARSKSTGPLTMVRQTSEKETVENKRRCVRRQSARFRCEEREPNENLFELEDLDISTVKPLGNPTEEDDDPNCLVSSIKNGTCRNEGQDSQRMSFGRPSRRAAEKVHSYKEVPLNTKMRRPV